MMDENISSGQIVSTAALFAAPEENVASEHVEIADPTGQLDEAERDMIRLRSMPINEVILEYLAVRDNLDEERHKWQAIENRLKDQLMRMSMVMREKGDALGVDNFAIRGIGTAYRNVKTSYRIADWDSYWKWLVATGNSHCVEKRPAKLAVQEVHRAGGEIPPGLDMVQEVEFLVRRSKA